MESDCRFHTSLPVTEQCRQRDGFIHSIPEWSGLRDRRMLHLGEAGSDLWPMPQSGPSWKIEQ